MNTLMITIASLVALFIIFQIWMVSRMKRMEGKSAPLTPGYDSGENSKSLYYFFSENCGACRAMTPVMHGLSDTSENVHLVDVTENPQLTREFGVMATPALVLVISGVVEKVVVGPQKPGQIEALLA